MFPYEGVAITTNCLAVEAKQQMSSQLKESVYSITIDETTDVGRLALVVRFYDNNFGIQDYFLRLLKVTTATAECFTVYLMQSLTI